MHTGPDSLANLGAIELICGQDRPGHGFDRIVTCMLEVSGLTEFSSLTASDAQGS